MPNLREKIEEILEKYRVGIVHHKIKSMRFPQNKATEQILQAFEEILPKESDILYDGEHDVIMQMGFNAYRAQIRERIGER